MAINQPNTNGCARSWRVLIVDDDPLQLKLSAVRLEDAGYEVTRARSSAEAMQLALSAPPDAIFSDVLMGETDGFGLCRRLRAEPSLVNVPIVLASAHYWDEKAHALATRVGASVLVGRTPEFEAELEALRGVIGQPRGAPRRADADEYEQHLRTNADQIRRLLGEAKSAEERYRALFESANDAVAVLDTNGRILEANQRWRQVLGIEPSELRGGHLLDFTPHGKETSGVELAAAIASGNGRVYAVPISRHDGVTVYVDFSISSIQVDAETLVFAIGRDVTGRFLAAQALAVAEEKYRSLVERMPDIVLTTSRERCVFVTANVERITGFNQKELYAAKPDFWSTRIHSDDQERLALAYGAQALQPESLFDTEYRWRRRDGAWIWLRHRVIAQYERGGVTYNDALLSDVTERRRLEDSLRQAQKMEAIGQLTGGIAHDFNNILATILANSEFLIDALSPQDPRLEDAREVKTAAERAAGLTRQLLAFSRRQVLELRVVDLNQVIANIERMLRRLIGEDIELEVRLESDLGRVHADPGQIEQVLMNLVVNARDAMPKGGKLTLETFNLDLDVLAGRPMDSPVPHVVVGVTDTGTGMDRATQSRLFEPFFTTKEVGKGTGLGLAVSHGIVAQCGGQLSVYSELGRGTTFKVYLPRVETESDQVRIVRPDRNLTGRELVLLAEDDVALRTSIKRMLANQGYRVLLADDAEHAVALAREHARELSLLLSDVVMPRVTGPELARAVREHVPEVKVLLMSGYTEHAALSGVTREHTQFIQKPFGPQALARKLRDVLDTQVQPTTPLV